MPPRELSRIDKFRRQVLGRGAAALQDRVEADLSGVVNALVDRAEGLALLAIRRVNDVPGSPELVGERDDPYLPACACVPVGIPTSGSYSAPIL